MNYRRTAVIAGVLFLISYIGVIMGSALLETLLNVPNPILSLHQHKDELMGGVLLELVNGIAVVSIAVLLYPLLKQVDEGLALGYLSMRILEAAMQVVMDLSPVTLLKLSQNLTSAGASDQASVQAMVPVLLAERQSAALLLSIFFCAGAAFFYILLYRSNLLPRFISVWGGLAVVLVFTSNVLAIRLPLGMLFALPIIGNEIFVAIWLIVKGFKLPVALSEPHSSAVLIP